MNARRFASLGLAGIACIACVADAGADPIEVPNAGFEERESFDPFPAGTDKYNQWGLETWRHFEVDNNGGPLRIWNPADPAFPPPGQGIADVGFGGEAPEGTYVVVVRSRYNDDEFHDPPQPRDFEAAVQLLDEPFDPGSGYTLTVEVGRLPGSDYYSPNWFGYAVQLAVGGMNVDGARFAGLVEGGTVIAEDHNTLDVAPDTFATSTVVYTPDPAHEELAGLPLQIRLCALEDPADHSTTGWVAFDDVRLETGAAYVAPFAITEIEYLPGEETVRLTWTSREGQTYAVRYSTDLLDWVGDLDDSVVADPGETTTRTFQVDGLSGPDGELYLRVERN